MKEKVLVFGTGDYYKINKKILNDFFEIVAFIDNDKKKQGLIIENKEVLSPQKIKGIKFDKIFVASMYIDVIREQLIKLGIKKEKIISDTSYMPIVEKKLAQIQYKIPVQNKSKKQILFCITGLGGGGAEKVLIDILNNFNYEKYEVTLLILCRQGIYFDNINKNVNLIIAFNSEAEKIFGYRALKDLSAETLYSNIVKIKSDVEIAFLEGEASKVISGSNSGAKKISWVHIDLNKNHWTKAIFKNIEYEKECYEKFDNIVCVSEGVKKSIIKLFGLNEEKLFVIYNIFEINNIIKLSKEMVNDNDAPNGFTFCAVGRLEKQKGFDRLIKAHAKLINENIKSNILILGQGSYKEKLLELAKKLKVENSVKFLGFQSNPYKFMKSSDVFVLSSREEGFPLVLCEALILGKPVITTDCCGVNEILEDGKYGIVVDNSEDGIYEGMKSIICDTEILKKYEKKSQSRISFFNKVKIMSNIEKLL
ncbi:glycosyltransferase [Clostridium felsineum]|uniref:glycosyltransferase n=1 Tax=Clostridium felsineum TaxID=36839 RepID=UPI0009C6377D|nr:glycosyltransferase [Clostridium felsineum]URZ00947.1 D-inositol-3-phosphate glycosyltransferase [Clostridium felsineum]